MTSRPSFLGAAVSRIEDDRLLTGRGCYVADITLGAVTLAANVDITVDNTAVDFSGADRIDGAVEFGILAHHQAFGNDDAAIQEVYGLTRVELENQWRETIGAPNYLPPSRDRLLPTPVPRAQVQLFTLTPQAGSQAVASIETTPTPTPEPTAIPKPTATPELGPKMISILSMADTDLRLSELASCDAAMCSCDDA